MSRLISISVILAMALLSSIVLGQDPARVRLEREAAGQAAQADKLFKAGQHAAALKIYRAERESRKTLGDARYEAFALRGIGCCLSELGAEDEAVEAFLAARELDANRDDKGFEGFDGLLLAKVHLRKGRPAEAVAALEQAIPKLDQAIDRDHECDARICLLTAKLRLGQADKAQGDAARSMSLAEELDDPRRLADAWLGSGLIDHELGRYGLAAERIQDARDAYRDQSRPSDEAVATRHLADLSYRLGRPDRAARRFKEAITLHAKLGDRGAEADDRLDLASILLELGDFALAINEASLARDSFAAQGDQRSRIDAMVVLAQAQSLGKGGLEAASATVKQAIGFGETTFRDSPAEQVRLLVLSAELEGGLKRPSEVTNRLDEASRIAAKVNDKSLRDVVDRARARLSK